MKVEKDGGRKEEACENQPSKLAEEEAADCLDRDVLQCVNVVECVTCPQKKVGRTEKVQESTQATIIHRFQHTQVMRGCFH